MSQKEGSIHPEAGMGRIEVLASPAWRNRKKNPFNFLLSEALVAEGCVVLDPHRLSSIFGKWDVVHIHWPEHAASGPIVPALGRIVALCLRLFLQRLKGARIVWTVHNIRGHSQTNVLPQRILVWIVARIVHGVIFLTPSSRIATCKEIPALQSKPYSIIPHGLYPDISLKTRRQARALFGLSQGPVVGFLGDIRHYKGLDLLLAAFEQTPPQEVTLLVAGIFQDTDYATLMRARIAGIKADGHSILFLEDRLDDSRLVDAIRACDVIALPYREMSNSGLALLILGNKGRILASDAPVFRELQLELGPEWIRIFSGALTGETLISAAMCGSNGSLQRLEAFCAVRSWSQIGRETVAFYRRLGA